MAREAAFSVVVGGQNITTRLSPYLLSLRVTDKAGTTSDSCDISLDDKDGQIAMPKVGAEMKVKLGWKDTGTVEVFVGKVDDVRATGARGGGRTMRITAKGLDTNSKAKEKQNKHIDKADLKKAMTDAGKGAGITDIKVDDELAKITRDYWALDGESFISFGQRVAREVGGTFRIRGNKAVIAKKGSGKSPSGKDLPTITGAYGDNLHTYDIAPVMGRPRQKKVKARYYDRKEAKWKETEAEVEDEGAAATETKRHTVADEDEGKSRNRSDKADAETDKGGGSAEIEGDVRAMPEGKFVLTGARPGIDGTYRIEGVTHRYSKSSGFTTSLDLKLPVGPKSNGKKAASEKK